LTAGYLLAVPFAVLTADPSFGRVLKETGLCGIPEDFDPPPEIRALEPGHRGPGSALPQFAAKQ
jgi:membrane glycosyltransferase